MFFVGKKGKKKDIPLSVYSWLMSSIFGIDSGYTDQDKVISRDEDE